MGRSKANKAEIVADLKAKLTDAQMIFIVDYQGFTVAEITDLRNRIRPAGGSCKVTKNTFMGLAIAGDERWQALDSLLSGSSAFILVGEEVGAVVKAFKEFQKATKKGEIRGGVMEGKVLSVADVEALGDLPSKEQLYAQIAGALNAVTAKIAIGIKEVPSSVARGIKAISEKDAA